MEGVFNEQLILKSKLPASLKKIAVRSLLVKGFFRKKVFFFMRKENWDFFQCSLNL